VAGVTRLYYDLAALDEDVSVKRESLALSEKLYQDNRAQVEAGTLAPIELVRAQAQIAVSREDLVNSLALVRVQELILKNVLMRTGTADPRVRDAHIVPTTPITIPEKDEISPVQDLIALALANRPDLLSAQIQLENSYISLKGSRNAILPQLNLVAAVQSAGLAGQLNPGINTSPGGGLIPGTPPLTPSMANIGGFGSVLSQIFQKTYPTYSIGLQLNLPLRNRIAQADYIRDQLIVRESEMLNQQLQNQARLQVEAAIIAIEQARALHNAAVQARQLQEQSLAIEQEKYAVGLSTTFLIIQYQSFVAQARSTEIVARSNYLKYKTSLDRATGQILGFNNISIDEAYRGRLSIRPSPPPALVPPKP